MFLNRRVVEDFQRVAELLSNKEILFCDPVVVNDRVSEWFGLRNADLNWLTHRVSEFKTNLDMLRLIFFIGLTLGSINDDGDGEDDGERKMCEMCKLSKWSGKNAKEKR